MKQRTIEKSISIQGTGLHTGQNVTMTFSPAPVNHGCKFQRIDVENQPILNADVSLVSSTNFNSDINDLVRLRP